MLSGGNPTDMKKLVDLLDAIVVEEPPLPPAAGGEPGGRELCLARGYADDECRAAAAERGDRAHIPPARRQGHPLPPPGHPDRHPPRRRVVEVAHSWFDRFRHLLIRWDKRADHYLAYVHLAACLIVYREIRHARTLSG